MKRLCLFALVVLCSIATRVQAQVVLPSQIEISALPGFNHTPMRVVIGTNAPGLVVSSDSTWVRPSVDVAGSALVLSFTTSNLVSSLYTATITASRSGKTNTMFVRAYVSQLNIVKLKDDPHRSRTYGIQQNGLTLGSVIVLDPVTTNYLGNITVGNKPSDLAESADGTELLVINCVDETISVIDLNTLAVKQTLPLPAFDNWGADSTTANLAVGPGNVLYYTDGAWAPALRVLDRTSMQVLQTVYSEGASGDGWGDLGLTSDKAFLFGWMQYGWSAGLASSYVMRFAVAADGRLTFLDAGPSQYSSTFARDPLDTPVLISSDNKTAFIKGFALGTNSASNVKYTLPAAVYSISPGGEIAVTSSAIYDTRTGIKLADLPVNTPVQAVSSDYARLVYYDSSAHAIKLMRLLDVVGPGILNRDIVPADRSITLSPPQLQWTPVPGVDRYRVYLGLTETAVAAATTNSPLFLGEVNQNLCPVATLTPGLKYYWRVDAVSEFDVTVGDVYEFTVSTISCSVSDITGRTVQGHSKYKVTFTLQGQTPGQAWSVSADRPWVSFTASTGTVPATVEMSLNPASLTTGVSFASVTVSSGSNALFVLPVQLTVDPLKLTVIKSDPLSKFVYGISEDTTATPARAYLLEIDTANESLERVTPVGASATDLAVHNGDNRLYVPNWMTGSLLAVDKATMQLVRSYAFAPFGGVGYSQGDIYRVSAGAPGRLVWEEEDQWINITIFDTVNATNFGTGFVRQGGGAFGPGGRYYYHGDDNSSGAEIHKYDVTGDVFTELAHIRVASVSYYGSRTVVVSEDGSRVFWNGSAFNANLVEQYTIGDEIFSTSANGHYGFSRTKVYDCDAKQALLGMPVDTAVSAFNSTSQKLVVQAGSSLAFFTITTPLTLPTPILSVDGLTYNSVALRWTDRSLENTFTLQRRLAGTTNWTDVATLARNLTQYTNTGLAEQTSFEFRIKAETTVLSSDWSPVLAVTTPGTLPATPSLNTPTATLTSISLSWTDLANESAYLLERSAGSSTNWFLLAALSANVTGYVDTNVVTLGTYYYRLKATNSFGVSAYSTVRSLTVPAPQPPAAPTGLIARGLTASSIQVSWNDNADETGYRLERRNENPTSYILVATLPANTTSYSDINLIQGMQYYYRLQATNANGASAYSSEAGAVPANMVYALQDDFDPEFDPLLWADISGGKATNGIQGFRGSKALYFAGTGMRSAQTIPLDVSGGGTMDFYIRAGNEAVDGTTLWNNSEVGELVVLEYSKDGANWYGFQTNNTVYPSLSSWANPSVAIPAAALSPTTRFRWRQLANSGPGFDTWAIDDVRIQCVAPRLPEPVPFLLCSPLSSTAIAIYWAAADRAASYTVERASGSSSWTQIGSVSALTTYFTDSELVPGMAYRYRITAVNASGAAPASMEAIAFTWTQIEQWIADNYGGPDALNTQGMCASGPGGVVLLLRYAFNLSADGPMHTLQPGGTSGSPFIWVDNARNRLCVEFVRRKAVLNPGITYQVQFGGSLDQWTASTALVSTVSIDSLWERVRYEDAAERTGAGSRFCRVNVGLQ